MGAWGPGVFENDHALDFISMVERKSFQVVRDCLARVNDAPEDQYLEVDECSQALAAAAVVAATRGRIVPDFPDEIKERLNTFRPKCKRTDVENALRAVKRIRAHSELKELWEERGGTKWHIVVEALISILTKSLAALRQEKSNKKITAKGKKRGIQEGDVILIPLSAEEYVVAKILFASRIFKHCILLGVTNVVTHSLSMPTSLPSKYIAQMYAADWDILEGIWHKVGNLPVSEEERQASLRLVGDEVWLGDELLRKASKRDMTRLPQMSPGGSIAVEYDIQVMLGRLKPGSVRERAKVWHLHGLLYLQRHEARSAIVYFDKAIEGDSRLAVAYWDRAKAWEALGNRERAEQDRKKAVSIDPSLMR